MISTSHTLAGCIRKHATRAPERLAFRSGENTISYGELVQRFSALNAVLRAHGFEHGDRLAIRLQKKLDFASVLYPAMACGAIAVPLDQPDMEGQRFIVDDSDARFIIHDDSLALTAADAPNTIMIPFDVLTNASIADDIAPNDFDAADPALILYTSGTQGQRKGVLLTHGNVISVADYVNEFMAFDDSAIEYICAPLDHAFGFGRARNVLGAGGVCVFDDGPFNPARLIQALEKYKCNAISTVATGMAIVVEHFSEAIAPYRDQIRWIKMGSQGLDLEYKKRLCDLFPTTRLVQNYGLTEAQRTTLVDFNSDRSHMDTSGRPFGPTQLQIVDDAGATVPAGVTGLIKVSGPHVTPGYWRNEEVTRTRIRDGWLLTDDLAYLDDDGYLHFVARADDMINIGGEKISPLDIEMALNDYLRDLNFVVCGINDPQGIMGEVMSICFEQPQENEFSWTGRRVSLLGKIPANRLPKYAFAIAKLPRTATGKIQRKILREQLESGTVTALK